MEQFIRVLKSHPWHIAVLGLLILTFTNGMTATGNTIFDRVFLDTFGWSPPQLKLTGTITFLGAAALVFFMGAVIDKIGVKPGLLFGTALLAVGVFAMSFVQSLSHLYLIYAAFALVLVTAGTNVVVILVSSLFQERRGLAIGIALMGTSIGGAVVSRLGAELLEVMSWREAFRVEAILPLILFVMILFFVPNTRARVVDDGPVEPDRPGFELREALRTRTFWALTISAMMTYFAIMAIVQNLVLHGTALDLPTLEVSELFFFLTLGAVITKFGVGALVDHFDSFTVYRLLHLVMIGGLLLLVTMRVDLLGAAVLVTALGWGGMYTLYNFMVIDLFGLKAAGKITGLVAVFEAVGAATGPLVLAEIYRRMESYQLGFAVLAVLLCSSLILSFLFRRNPKTDSIATAR